jgi:hypothetical protein
MLCSARTASHRIASHRALQEIYTALDPAQQRKLLEARPAAAPSPDSELLPPPPDPAAPRAARPRADAAAGGGGARASANEPQALVDASHLETKLALDDAQAAGLPPLPCRAFPLFRAGHSLRFVSAGRWLGGDARAHAVVHPARIESTETDAPAR